MDGPEGAAGKNFGGDSSLRFHTAVFLFSPQEAETIFIDGETDDPGYQSASELNLLPHFPVVVAVGSKSPSYTRVIDSWNHKQLPEFIKRITVMRCRVDNHVIRHLTHKDLKNACITASKLEFQNDERWKKG